MVFRGLDFLDHYRLHVCCNYYPVGYGQSSKPEFLRMYVGMPDCLEIKCQYQALASMHPRSKQDKISTCTDNVHKWRSDLDRYARAHQLAEHGL